MIQVLRREGEIGIVYFIALYIFTGTVGDQKLLKQSVWYVFAVKYSLIKMIIVVLGDCSFPFYRQ